MAWVGCMSFSDQITPRPQSSPVFTSPPPPPPALELILGELFLLDLPRLHTRALLPYPKPPPSKVVITYGLLYTNYTHHSFKLLAVWGSQHLPTDCSQGVARDTNGFLKGISPTQEQRNKAVLDVIRFNVDNLL